jgi:hypothetical protein
LEVPIPISKSGPDNKTFISELKEGVVKEHAWIFGARFEQTPYPTLG